MATTVDPRAVASTKRSTTHRIAHATLTKVLVSCGIVYALTYALVNDAVAAFRYDGYSRMDQAVSELSATGAPTRPMLMVMLFVWTALMVAFGLGVWRAADGRRWLQGEGVVLMAFGVMGIAWLWFPMTSRQDMVNGTMPDNDLGHLVLSALTVLFILAQLGFGAAAFGWRFRLYSLVTALTVLGFGSMTAVESAKIPTGEPTPWLGLYERINIWAWLLFMAVLAVTLLREARPAPDQPAERRPQASPSPG